MESDFRIRARKVLKVLLWGLFVFIAVSAILELYPAAQHPALQGRDRRGGMSHRKEGTPGFSPDGLHKGMK